MPFFSCVFGLWHTKQKIKHKLHGLFGWNDHISSITFLIYPPPKTSDSLFPYFLPPAPNPSGWVFSLTQLWSVISARLLIFYQCKAQIHISKQWVTSPSWFWFFCYLSGSVSISHRITNPEHDTLQTPVDHWGLTTDVCVWLHVPTHKHTFTVNAKMKRTACLCLSGRTGITASEERPQINITFENQHLGINTSHVLWLLGAQCYRAWQVSEHFLFQIWGIFTSSQ